MRPSILRRFLGLATVATSAASAGCGETPKARADHSGAPAVTRVEIVRPERRTIRRSTEQPGRIEAYEVTSVHARVSGFVEKWTVDIGTKVTKGQTLAVLSVPEIDAEAEQKRAVIEESEARLAQARAEEQVAEANLASMGAKLTEAQAGVKRADADFARWQAEYKRIEQLFNDRAQTGTLLDETRSKVKSSESARDEVYAQVKTAEAAVRHGQALIVKARSDVTTCLASIKVARADLRRVEAIRQFATVVAPYDGIVTVRNVDVGDLTQIGSQGRPLFTVARDDLVRITVSVPEMYATSVDPGDRAVMRLQAVPSKDFEGKVARTSWTLDAKNRTLRTEIDAPNPKGTLRPGLYAHATIVVDQREGVLAVPVTAVGREGEKAFCVVVHEGHAARRPVEVGLSDGAWTVILSGLNGDEVVASANAGSLADGQPVEAVEPKKSAAPGAKR